MVVTEDDGTVGCPQVAGEGVRLCGAIPQLTGKGMRGQEDRLSGRASVSVAMAGNVGVPPACGAGWKPAFPGREYRLLHSRRLKPAGVALSYHSLVPEPAVPELVEGSKGEGESQSLRRLRWGVPAVTTTSRCNSPKQFLKTSGAHKEKTGALSGCSLPGSARADGGTSHRRANAMRQRRDNEKRGVKK